MKTVIEMAREAGFKASVGKTDKDGKYHPDVNALSRDVPIEWLERFAELVRADEREACAKVCEDNATDLSEGDWDSACINCADYIRARGQRSDEASLRSNT